MSTIMAIAKHVAQLDRAALGIAGFGEVGPILRLRQLLFAH